MTSDLAQARAAGWSMRLRPSAALAPSKPRVNIIAALTITGLIVALGTLTRAGLLPWVRPGGAVLSLQAELLVEPPVIVVWFLFVQIAALLVPLLAFALIGWRDRRARAALAPYLLILGSHILSEAILRYVFFTNISLFLGLLYSPYRAWQSWYLHQEFSAEPARDGWQRFTGRLLLAESIIWAINLVMLIIFKLPRCIGAA